MKAFLYAGIAALVLLMGSLWLPSLFTSTNAVEEFLAQHWARPLAAQGVPPSHYSALEASLAPEDCGQCHAQQWNDWRQSLHSQTMTAGVQWQLRLMGQQDANKCLDCHAPLAEQKALVALQQQWPLAPKGALPQYVSPNLSDHGLVCAACHVRGHQRFGPERLDGTQSSAVAHQGFVPHKAYSDSQFCASCHQFPEDGPRTAGKLREDTYQEWLASPYAAQGIQCQNCHMPDRKHQWQGIHSQDMVKQALSVTWQQHDGRVEATLRNSGAGHKFPTYMVPKVIAQLWWQQDEQSLLLAEHVLGWQVSVDLTTEQFDQRLAPNEAVTLTGVLPKPTGQVSLRLLVIPREHYERSFAYSLTYAEKMDHTTLALLKQAMEEAKAARYQWDFSTFVITESAP